MLTTNHSSNFSSNFSSPFTGNGTMGDDSLSQSAVKVPIMTYVMITVAAVSIVIGMTGNLLIVIVRIFRQLQRKNTTAYTFLISQLAIADFIFAFTIIFDLHMYLNKGHWYLGLGVCRSIRTLQSVSSTTTVGFLTTMAYERYRGISKPLQHRWSIKKTAFIVLGIWFYTFLTFIPFTLALGISKENFCYEIGHPSEAFRKGYTMFLFITNYIIPLLIVIILHTLIVVRMKKHLKSMRDQRHRVSPSIKRKLKKHNDGASTNEERARKTSIVSTYSIGEDAVCGEGETNCWVALYKLLRNRCGINRYNVNNNITSSSIKILKSNVQRSNAGKRSGNVFKRLITRSKTNEDRKLIQMLVAVTLSFAVMTLPTQIWYIWTDFGGVPGLMKNIFEVLASLVYLHCCSNCIIYSVMDKRFRADVRRTVRYIFNCKPDNRLRKSFQRVTVISRLSRSSRYSQSTTRTTTTKSTGTSSADDALHEEEKVPKTFPTPNNNEMFVIERETVIL